ncbi:GNAT family N-acetyltransferase [Streptomyces sp. KC 17012]|jgi:predicted acetyltransferase|nr:GNAT family N-acetyltransferase [Streptomyces plumbidurans]PTM92928.1 acetyltransferase (GNAT) family protein [Streptomyces sp. VMFN-G11Ma]
MCDDQVAHSTRHGYGDFAVRDASTHAFLSQVGLRNRPRFGVDLGFALHPRAQGRGIAGEAGRACQDLAFRRLSLPAVYAFVLPGNEASIAVLRRLGAQADGTVQSSGLHCLRYVFGPTSTTAAERTVDDGGAHLQLVHAAGTGSSNDQTALSQGPPDPFGSNVLGLVRVDRQHTLARTVISVAVEHARAAGAETVIVPCHPDLVPRE